MKKDDENLYYDFCLATVIENVFGLINKAKNESCSSVCLAGFLMTSAAAPPTRLAPPSPSASNNTPRPTFVYTLLFFHSLRRSCQIGSWPRIRVRLPKRRSKGSHLLDCIIQPQLDWVAKRVADILPPVDGNAPPCCCRWSHLCQSGNL